MEEKRFALLIDADNISAKYIKYMSDEISKYGNVTYKRIYGDWTKNTATSWKELLLKHSIVPIQQYGYTTGKNATDSAMIIDAMDILYSERVEGFCLASSDSDFTRLATRLRESGMMVIGMGEKKTPEAFRAACDRFTYLDLIASLDEAEAASAQDLEGNTVDITMIENAMIRIITENGNDGKETGIAELGSRLVKLYPDFDVRNYGYTKLTKFLEGFKSLRVKMNRNTIMVSLIDAGTTTEDINKIILQFVMEAGSKGIAMGDLSNKIHLQVPNFNIRDYGYSKFSKFIQEIVGVKTIGNGRTLMVTARNPKK